MILILKLSSQFIKATNGLRIKEAEVIKGPKINTKKQNHHDLHRDWTIVTFESFAMSYFTSSYGHFQQNRQPVSFFYFSNNNNKFHFCIPLKSASFLSWAVRSHPTHHFSYATDSYHFSYIFEWKFLTFLVIH